MYYAPFMLIYLLMLDVTVITLFMFNENLLGMYIPVPMMLQILVDDLMNDVHKIMHNNFTD